MSEDDDLGKAAEAYWKRLIEAGGHKETHLPKRKAAKGKMPEDSDSTDPVVLIVQTVLDNVEVTKELVTESKTARLAMAETERKMSLRADTASAEMRSLTLAVQNFTASQAAIERLKSDRYIWVLGGAMIGAALASFALTELPLMWRQIFG